MQSCNTWEGKQGQEVCSFLVTRQISGQHGLHYLVSKQKQNNKTPQLTAHAGQRWVTFPNPFCLLYVFEIVSKVAQAGPELTI